MLNLAGMLTSSQSYEVTMKPTGMSKKAGKTRRPEYVCKVIADDKNHAARIAREHAAIEGFNGYAITKIKEIQQ